MSTSKEDEFQEKGIKSKTDSKPNCKKRHSELSNDPEQTTDSLRVFRNAIDFAKSCLKRKPPKEVTIRFEIHGELRRKVVGPRGKTIKGIARVNGVQISVGRAQFPSWPNLWPLLRPNPERYDSPYPVFGTDPWGEVSRGRFERVAVVLIRGDVVACKRAQKEILDVMDKYIESMRVETVVSWKISHWDTEIERHLQEKFPQAKFDIKKLKDREYSLTLTAEKAWFEELWMELKRYISGLEGKMITRQVNVPQYLRCAVPEFEEKGLFVGTDPDDPKDVLSIFSNDKATVTRAKAQIKAALAEYHVKTINLKESCFGSNAHVLAVVLFLERDNKIRNIARSSGVEYSKLTKDDTFSIIVVGKDKSAISLATELIEKLILNIPPECLMFTDYIPLGDIPEAKRLLQAAARKNNVEYVQLQGRFALLCQSNQAPADPQKRLVEVKNSLSSLTPASEPSKETSLYAPSYDQHHRDLASLLKEGLNEDVQIFIHRDKHKEPSPNELYVCGSKTAIEKVKTNLQTILKDIQAFETEGPYVKTIKVPSHVLTRLIKAKRQGFHKLERKWQVKIRIHDQGREYRARHLIIDRAQETKLTIEGVKYNVELAAERLLEEAESLSNMMIERVTIPYEYMSRVAGFDCENLKDLCEKFGVQVSLPHFELYFPIPKSKNEIVIEGSSLVIGKAKEALIELYEAAKKCDDRVSLKVLIELYDEVYELVVEDIGLAVDCVSHTEKKIANEEGYGMFELAGTKENLELVRRKIERMI